jgi:excisionase family DNA binding protein
MPLRSSTMTLTLGEAAHILGCSVHKVQMLIKAGDLTGGARYQHRALNRDQVEHLAVQRWKPPRPGIVDDATSYWVTTTQAAELLGVGRTRVGQLVDRGFLPCVHSPRGHRLFRRGQVEVIANARLSRRLQA